MSLATIELKYCRDIDNPNFPPSKGGMTTGQTVLWARFRDTWIRCPGRSIIRTLKDIQEFLETDKIKTLEYENFKLKQEIKRVERL